MSNFVNSPKGGQSGGYAGPNSQKFLGTLLNSIPYSNSVFNIISDQNPKFADFNQVTDSHDAAVAKHSVFRDNNNPIGEMIADKGYAAYINAKVDVNKIRRIQDYRRMAAYAELSDALDEICDEAISRDLDGNFITCEFSKEDGLSDNATKELRKEWKKFINLFNLADKGFDYFRQFLIDGELFFENIIDNPDYGIRDVQLLPPELINPAYANRQNDIIENFILRKPIYDANTPNIKESLIPLHKNQITYVNSGIWNEDRTIRLPYIENSRRAYKQLTLIEDSIIIYRMVRAPERMVFKVDVGNMNAPQSEAYMKRLMQQYWSKRSFSGNDGQVSNSYDPQSMLDAFWFPKRGNSEGTTVDVLPGGANLGELSDLEYFLHKLYKTLKVPTARLNAETTVSAGAEEITREELRFAKFVIRVQRQFAMGLKDSFIVHLKLRKLWDQYKLKANTISIEFATPTNFMVLKNQQIFGLLADNFSTMSQNEGVANSYAQRHYMKYNDGQMAENREWLRKDAEMRWELAQIESMGPDWKAQQGAAMDIDPGGADLGGDFGGGGGAVGGDSAMPDFGPAPEVDVGGETAEPEAAPDVGVEEPAP